LKINLEPLESIKEEDLRKGLLNLKIDGIFSQSMGVLISGTFIVPLLLLLGADSFYVGLLSTIISLASLSQLLSLNIMNLINGRKKVSVIFSFLARISLLILSICLLIKLINNAIYLMMFLALFYFLTNTSSGAFNYWMLELVPQNIRGRYFASRTRIALLLGSIIGLIAVFYLDTIGNTISTYSQIMFIAAVLGLIGIYFLARIPEPKFNGSEPFSLRAISEFLKSENLKKHFQAISFLYLAINLSTPFFVYYMLTMLNLSISWVFIITITGQIFTILILPKWGWLIDKYGVKAVLRFSAYILILTLLLWPFTTLPNRHIFSIPLLFIIYMIMGATMGGLNLSSNLIAYYLARDKKASYGLSLNNIFISIGSIVGSFLGALLSIPTSYMELSMTFNLYLSEKVTIFIIDLKGLDFVFVISALLGFSSLSLFRRYKIDDEKDDDKNYVEIVIGFKRFIRNSRDQILFVISRGIKHLNYKNGKLKSLVQFNAKRRKAKQPIRCRHL